MLAGQRAPISAPELPAPTTRRGPRGLRRIRYWPECSSTTTDRAPSRDQGGSVTRSIRHRTTTLLASNRRSPAAGTILPSFLESLSTRARFHGEFRTAWHRPRGSPPSRPSSGTNGERPEGMPSSPSWRAGVNSRNESQRFRQASPTRSPASRITKGRSRRARWYPAREARLASATIAARRALPCVHRCCHRTCSPPTEFPRTEATPAARGAIGSSPISARPCFMAKSAAPARVETSHLCRRRSGCGGRRS